MRKNRFIILLSLIFVLSMAFSAILATVSVSADAITPTVFTMKKGASIRVDNGDGLRFAAIVDGTTISTVDEDDNSCFGALIVPYDYFETYSVSALKGTDYVKAFASAGASVTVKEDLTVSSADTDGNHLVACSITNLKYTNFNREFFGIIYIKTGTGDAATYTYADFINQENVRSADYVAYRTYEDYKDIALSSEIAMLKSYIAKGYLDDGTYENEADFNAAVENAIATEQGFEEVLVGAEVNQIKGLMEALPASAEDVTIYDAYDIEKVKTALEGVSESAKEQLTLEIALFNDIENYYNQRYQMIAFGGNWMNNGTTGTWAANHTVKQNYFEDYGNVMEVKVEAPTTLAERNLRINMSFGLVREMMEENEEILAVRFGMYSSYSSQLWEIADTAYKYCSANAWNEITLTREEVLSVEKDSSSGTYSYTANLIEIPLGVSMDIYFTNFYVLTSTAIAEETVQEIEKIPQTVEAVDAFSGSLINKAYALFSMLNETGKNLVTNTEVLETIKQYYDERYSMVNKDRRAWVTSVNSGTWASQYTVNLEDDTEYGKVVRLDIAQGSGTASHFRVILPMTDIQAVLNADESIAEVRFAVWSTATERAFELNGTSSKMIEQNEWTECTITRAEALASNGNFSRAELVTDSAHTVKISSFYVVKSGPIVESVIELINTLPQTIGEVSIYQGSKISEVYAIYENLPDAYKAHVTNASVLTTIKEYYDANYGIVYDGTSPWIQNGRTSNYAGIGTISLYNDEQYGTVIKCDVDQKTEIANSERYSVLTPASLKTFVSADESISEIKFMFRSSKTLNSNVFFNGKYSSCQADTWTEYTLTRDEILAKNNIRLTLLGFATDSAETLYFTNFFYVKTAQ